VSVTNTRSLTNCGKSFRNYAAKHKPKAMDLAFGLVTVDSISTNLSPVLQGQFRNLVSVGKGKNPRRMTPRECARLMGYPEEFPHSCVRYPSVTSSLVNSVAVPVSLQKLASVMTPHVVFALFRGAGERPTQSRNVWLMSHDPNPRPQYGAAIRGKDSKAGLIIAGVCMLKGKGPACRQTVCRQLTLFLRKYTCCGFW